MHFRLIPELLASPVPSESRWLLSSAASPGAESRVPFADSWLDIDAVERDDVGSAVRAGPSWRNLESPNEADLVTADALESGERGIKAD
jgi:hypothetical protein